MTIPLVTESIESQLVRLRRVQFTETGKFQGERTYQVRDAFNNLMDVRIDGATEIATNFLEIPSGEIDLVGVVSQFRGTYQMQPRFAEDVGVTIEEDTVSRERTLDITTWNLYWFGSEDTTQGPSDKTRQAESIRRAMDSIGADMYAVQEVVGAAPLAALAAELDGTYASLYTEEIPSTQKMAYIYNTKKLALLSSALAVNGGSQAWAGGRFPYRATFRADIQGQERTLHVFNIHGKATGDTTAYEDYERRKTDATTFHTYLQDFYADSIIAVVGDYNDDLTVSVIDELLVTPYVAFTEDTTNWTAPTRTYGEEGLASYIGGDRSMVDHVMLSNELAPFHYRTKLETPNAYISSYTATTSDHLPVTARIWGGGTITSVNEVSMPLAALRIAPNPMSTHGAVELTLERTAAVRVSVVDAVGREVAVVLNETLEPQIRVLSLPVHDLGNGMYNVVVRMGADVSSTPMLVVR
jgi:endonuclease/exonuclease/phosphatase family metal-dependent hydrolase